MPNWCENYLSVRGKSEDFKKFHDVIYSEKEDYQLLEKLYPTPEELLEGEGWYNWRINHWGTKWKEDDLIVTGDPNEVDDNDLTEISFYFNTAWSPPIEAFDKISADYPKLLFALYYEEPGMGFCGKNAWINGESIENSQGELIRNEFDTDYLYDAFISDEVAEKVLDQLEKETQMENNKETEMEETQVQEIEQTMEVIYKLSVATQEDSGVASIFGITGDQIANMNATTLGNGEDIYDLIDEIDKSSLNSYSYVSVLTSGWAAPLGENGEVEGRPSEHKLRRRVRLAVILDIIGKSIVGSVLKFDDDEDFVFDNGNATGSLSDAILGLVQ